MIMVNLAPLVNDKNALGYKMTDLLKEFMDKYKIDPADVEIHLSYPGQVYLKVKV